MSSLLNRARGPAGVTVICLVAHDIERLFESLESYYDYADEILFGIESRNLSMSMQPCIVPRSFYERVIHYPKVRVVQREFYSIDRRPLENETHQRSMLSAMARDGNWVVQIDADEVVVNPDQFFPWLLRQSDDALVMGRWVQLFKMLDDDTTPAPMRRCFVVCEENGQSLYPEAFPVATYRRSAYTCARYTDQKPKLSPLWTLHYSWARSEEAVVQKMRSWGHSDDIDREAYLRLWRSVSADNYRDVVDFHPMVAGQWPRLACLTLQQIEAWVRGEVRRDTPLYRSLCRARRLAVRIAGRERRPGGPSRFALRRDHRAKAMDG